MYALSSPSPSVPTPPWFLPISSSHSYVRHRTTQIVCFSVFCFVSFCLLSAALEAALAHPHACVCLSLCLSVCVAVPVCVCACVHVRPASLLCLAPLSCHFSSLHNIFQVFDVSFAPNAHQFLDSLPASCSFSLPSFSTPPTPHPTLLPLLLFFASFLYFASYVAATQLKRKLNRKRKRKAFIYKYCAYAA